jgi:uncharacterized membrane-anchored protein
MHIEHVPKIDALYWFLLGLASVFGANASDLLVDGFGLTHAAALGALLLAFALVLAVERFDRGRPYVSFWLALLVTRMAAADISDIGRALLPHHPLPVLVVIATLCLTLYCWRLAPAAPSDIPAIHPLFWWTMLAAGAAGSMIGACLSEELVIGNVAACALPAALVPLLVLAARGYRPYPFALYWLAVVALHAAGSAAADLFAHEVLSLALSTFVFGVAFGMVLTAMRILAAGPPAA